jgi:hypothetical protein
VKSTSQHVYMAGFVCLSAIFLGSIYGDDRSGTTSSEDNKERWLFEFEVSSNKPLGTRDEIIDIKSIIEIEARRMSHSAVVTGFNIQWISPSLVVAKAAVARAEASRLLCVCEKHDANWRILYVYRIKKVPFGKLQ